MRTFEAYPYSVHAVILAGGKGTRLLDVTEGKIPKAAVTIEPSNRTPGHDFLIKTLQHVGVQNISLVADTFLSYYADQNWDKQSVRIIPQRTYPNTAGALLEVCTELPESTQILLISSDFVFAPSDLRRLLQAHHVNTVSWAVNRELVRGMEGYRGLLLNDQNEIVGDRDLVPLIPEIAQTEHHPTEVTKLGIQVIDLALVMLALQLAEQAGLQDELKFDWYWGLCPLLEKLNQSRLKNKEPSLLYGVIFEHPALDYGTPDRLALTRWLSGLLQLYV